MSISETSYGVSGGRLVLAALLALGLSACQLEEGEPQDEVAGGESLSQDDLGTAELAGGDPRYDCHYDEECDWLPRELGQGPCKKGWCMNGACLESVMIGPDDPAWNPIGGDYQIKCISWQVGTCNYQNRANGSTCCKDGVGGGQGSCSSGTCVRSASNPYGSTTTPVKFTLTDKAINKYLYKQFNGSAWNSTGIGGSVSGCVPTGGTTTQRAQCLAQAVTGGTCNGLAYCAKQTLTYNFRIDIPKVTFVSNAVKLTTTLYVRSSSHPQFNRDLRISPTVSIPSGSVSATSIVRFLTGVQTEVNSKLALLGEIAKDLKNHAVARLSPEISISGIVPQSFNLFPEEVVLFPMYDVPRRFANNKPLKLVLNDVTLSWAIVSGKLEVSLTPKLNACEL